jgi:hypothetical protein
MNDKRVLLIGDYQHRDFSEAVRWLTQHTRLTRQATIARGLRFLSLGEYQDAVLLAQSRPGQFSARWVEALHVASPLTRLVGLLGSWCEGEMRTGSPWPGVIRVMWHQWQPRLVPQLQADSVASGSWSLPRTANVAEQMAETADAVWQRCQGLVAIHAQSFRTYCAISDACRQVGYSTAWCSPAQPLHASGFAAAIVDGIAADGPALGLLGNLVRQIRPAPVVALLDYVRRQDFDQAMAAGVAAVVAKPLLTYDLLWHLDNLVNAPQRQQTPGTRPDTQSPVTSAA